MKIFFVLFLLIALVYCAEKEEEQKDAALVDSEMQEESRRACTWDIYDDCRSDCDCCGQNSYCTWNKECRGFYDHDKASCEKKVEKCSLTVSNC
nr:venom protein [Lampona murina]